MPLPAPALALTASDEYELPVLPLPALVTPAVQLEVKQEDEPMSPGTLMSALSELATAANDDDDHDD